MVERSSGKARKYASIERWLGLPGGFGAVRLEPLVADLHLDAGMLGHEAFEPRQALGTLGLVFGVGAGLHAMLPSPCGVASVPHHEHRSVRRAREVRGASAGVPRHLQGPDRAVAEEVEHAVEST